MIEIPGYRVIRPLGRGGMATVYLALQESVQREVALKVMSQTLLGDTNFGERFLREARIAAKLRHPHVVQVHDVGQAGDHHYIAMEYLPGGPALTRAGSPREPREALRIVREIAGALGYAQSKGVVHRDIKPDNILLREDGAAVITDFGIARASDNSRMTRTGAIIGTPHYMSPEQARGLPLDGRADLYSLGIVFHELLLGRVPYQADDSLAVGIMHITAPLPRLPAEHAYLQPILDRLLAKDPEQRFQDGAELAAAIDRIEREFASDPRDAPLPYPTREFDRAEPVLGRLDDVFDAPRGRRDAEPPARAGRDRDPRQRTPHARGDDDVGGWQHAPPDDPVFPDERISWRHDAGDLRPRDPRQRDADPPRDDRALRSRDERAARPRDDDAPRESRRRNRSGDSRGRDDRAHGAVFPPLRDDRAPGAGYGPLGDDDEGFAPQGDHESPRREGRSRTGAASGREARGRGAGSRRDEHARSGTGRAATAPGPRRWLAGLAVTLLLIGAGAWVFQDALRDLWPQTRMNDLLARADQALVENRLGGPDGARELYAAAAALDPDSLTARQGLQRVGLRQLEIARSQFAAGDLVAARAALADARALSVPSADADQLQRELDERESRGVEIGALLDAAQRALREGRLDSGDDGAVALYRRALAAEPASALAQAGLRDTHTAVRGRARALAQAGLRDTLTALLDRARALIAAGQYDQAAAQVEAVAALDASHLGLPDARAQLAEARSQRQSGIDAQLDAADGLAKAGKLTAPAGGNARDAYRAVLQADPGNQRAADGLRRIAQSLLAQAQRRMADFEFDPAIRLIDQAESVDAKVPGLAAARTRLRDLQKRAASIPDPAAPETQSRVTQLLAEAELAAAAGNLLTPPGDSAYDKYRAVRSLDPDNAKARNGLAALPGLARTRFEQAVGAGKLATARGTIEALATLAPTDSNLPDMRRKLARSLLGQAAEKLGANELPKAREAFEQARELDPTNPELAAMQARLEQAGG